MHLLGASLDLAFPLASHVQIEHKQGLTLTDVDGGVAFQFINLSNVSMREATD